MAKKRRIVKVGISGVILARNEEEKIGVCIESLGWCDEVIVIDDGSEDGTVVIARRAGVRVIERNLRGNFAAQRNFGLKMAKGEWVLFVDADERVSDGLREEIKREVEKREKAGFYLRRVDVMWGKELTFGEMGRVRLLRLARRRGGRWRRTVDEVWEVDGRVGELKEPLIHLPHQTVSEFVGEINFKSSLNARQFFDEGKGVRWWDWGKPVGKFLIDWLWWGGWRDGMPGFLVALCMSFHSFLVRGKLSLMRK